MKCRLCGRPPAGRSDLCLDCSRALTRAREGSAALRELPKPKAGGRRALDKITLGSPVTAMPAAASRHRQYVGLGLLAVLAIALIIVAARGLSPQRGDDGAGASRALRAAAAQELRDAAEQEEEAEATYAKPTDTPKLLPAPPVPARAQPSARTARTPAIARTGSASNTARNRTSDDTPAGSAAPVVGSSGEDSMRLARASPPQVATSVDEGRSLLALLEKCSQERFLAGVICEQKVRLKYCEGKWGQDPQCTAKPRVD
jgi:hypothetical protein